MGLHVTSVTAAHRHVHTCTHTHTLPLQILLPWVGVCTPMAPPSSGAPSAILQGDRERTTFQGENSDRPGFETHAFPSLHAFLGALEEARPLQITGGSQMLGVSPERLCSFRAPVHHGGGVHRLSGSFFRFSLSARPCLGSRGSRGRSTGIPASRAPALPGETDPRPIAPLRCYQMHVPSLGRGLDLLLHGA